MNIKDAFNDIPSLPLPQKQGVGGSPYLDNLLALQIGYGNTTMKANKNGMWLGAKKATDAPFSVDMNGNVIASSIDLVGNYVAAGGSAADINAHATLMSGIKIVSLSITGTQIANDSISTPKLQANSVTANEIATNAITAGKILAHSITADRMLVTDLSAISANIGTITAGTISGVTITSSAGNSSRIILDSGNYLRFYGGGSERSRLRGVSASGAVGVLDEIGSFVVTREQGFLASSNTGNTDFFKFFCNSAAQGVIQLPSTNILRVLSSDGATNEITYSVSNGFFSNRKGSFNSTLECKELRLDYGDQNEGNVYGIDQLHGYNDLRLYVDNGGGKIRVENTNIDMVNHNIDAGGISYFVNHVNTSDKRLKKDIHSYEFDWKKISKIRPVTFNWKKGDTRLQYGIIAQDIQKLFPELIFKDDKGMLSVDYIGFIPILIKAIQVLYDRKNI